MGQAPGNAYSCIVCGKDVHALERCSYVNGEEAYGQARICMECKYKTSENKTQSDNFNEESIFNMNARTEKNWRELNPLLPLKKKLRFSYVYPQKNCETINLSQNSKSINLKTNIMKNCTLCKPVKVGRSSILLSNIFMFDSFI